MKTVRTSLICRSIKMRRLGRRHSVVQSRRSGIEDQHPYRHPRRREACRSLRLWRLHRLIRWTTNQRRHPQVGHIRDSAARSRNLSPVSDRTLRRPRPHARHVQSEQGPAHGHVCPARGKIRDRSVTTWAFRKWCSRRWRPRKKQRRSRPRPGRVRQTTKVRGRERPPQGARNIAGGRSRSIPTS